MYQDIGSLQILYNVSRVPSRVITGPVEVHSSAGHGDHLHMRDGGRCITFLLIAPIIAVIVTVAVHVHIYTET